MIRSLSIWPPATSAKQLLGEHQLRQRAGLPGDFLDHAMLLDEFGIARAGAIVSPGAADADPMQLSRGLLRIAVARGARLFEGEALEFDPAGLSVGVQLQNGRQIEARSVVLATGYVMPAIIHSTVQTISSSWAIATCPQPQNLWRGGALIWEDSKDYIYARTTYAGRIIIGGEDSETIIEPNARDRLIPEKSRLLAQKLAALWPVGTCQHRIPLVRNVRYYQRWLAVNRCGPRGERPLRCLWLWRQRDHIQFSRRSIDRRPDCGIGLASVKRFRARSGWRLVIDLPIDANRWRKLKFLDQLRLYANDAIEVIGV